MAYLALYRMFRPSTLSEVLRQEHIVQILKNQIATDRIGHAYLFCGPRGTGKTSIARIFANAINCTQPIDGSPCGCCPTCKALASGSMDLVEIDAASNNGVDEMRSLREKVQYPPASCRYKVYIIDEVHMLSSSAFNALLKTLEEPPAHAVFVLATTEPQKVPATILSRCMRLDFKLIPNEDLEAYLKHILQKIGKEYDEEAVSAIARAGAGSVRDMLSVADTCVSFSRGKLTYADVNAVLGGADFFKTASLCRAILQGNLSSALTFTEDVISSGKSLSVVCRDVLQIFNHCSIAKLCKNAKEILSLPDDLFAEVMRISSETDGHRLLRATEIVAAAEMQLKYSSSPRVTLETAIIKAAMPAEDYNIDALLGRMADLERKLDELTKNGVPVAVSPAKAEPTVALADGQDDAFDGYFPEEPVEDGGFYMDDEPEAEERYEPPVKKQTAVEQKHTKAPTATPSVAPTAPALPSAISPEAKRGTFAKFIRALRKSGKNLVLFTLCSDLKNEFEGDKFVLFTDRESVYNTLTRAENYEMIGECLNSIGISQFEIRTNTKNADPVQNATDELKRNFSGVKVTVK